MKLNVTQSERKEPVDIKELLSDFADEYDSVFIEDFGEPDGVFIFTSLGRKDYREIIEVEELSDASKEEVICERCTLYPKNYDFENCENAGLPTKLAKLIIEKSLLKAGEQLTKAIHYCRDKFANSLDDQISCIIHEAFPEFTFEEISNWDVIKTADYMVRAEYTLHNLRGVPITPVQQVPQEEIQAQQATEQRQQPQTKPQRMEERFKPLPKERQESQSAKPQRKSAKGDLAHLQSVAPGIDWAHDSVFKEGVKSLTGQNIDDRSAAEIPLDGSEDGQNAIPEALRHRFKVISVHDASDPN